MTKAKQLHDEHQRLGRQVTQIIADYAASLDERLVSSSATPADLARMFDAPLPATGTDAETILQQFEQDVLPHSMQIPSPRYFGLFNPTPLAIGVWADALASAINQNGAAWRNSPAVNVIEAQVLRWLCTLFGYGGEAFGTLTSGGSEANLIALKCARDRAFEQARDEGLRGSDATNQPRGKLIVYASEQCHYSFVKSVDILGLGRANLRKIETDERFHIRIDALRREMQRDIEAGHTPVAIAGAAGATSNGIVDPLDELAGVAAEFATWFHVDAAYGGALAFSEKHKSRLRGIERADSITVDPHKWMFVPFACGAVLVRDGGRVLRDGFDITPEYLSEERVGMGGADVEHDFFRYGQLGTRRANALKIWMAMCHLGVAGYAKIIDRHIKLTHRLARLLSERNDFEIIGEVETAVCCFRFVPEAARVWDGERQDRLQRSVQARIEASGKAWFATTILRGRRVLRVNVNSYLTEERHIDELFALVVAESTGLMKEEVL
jgi:aromatic-L-amino-acid decarboxylase